jgi:uncharacterized C2H2 Zn-finger protein
METNSYYPDTYMCPVCDAEFEDWRAYAAHLKKHHKEEDE